MTNNLISVLIVAIEIYIVGSAIGFMFYADYMDKKVRKKLKGDEFKYGEYRIFTFNIGHLNWIFHVRKVKKYVENL